MYCQSELAVSYKKHKIVFVISLIFLVISEITFAQEEHDAGPSTSRPNPATKPKDESRNVVPPPQNTPNLPPPEEEVPPPPPPPVIFGLNNIILIMNPYFECKIPYVKSYVGAKVKVSLPITVFFDKLNIPPPFEPPPPEAFPFVPFQGPFFPHGHFVSKRSAAADTTEDISPSTQIESRSPLRKSMWARNKRALRYDATLYKSERVALISRLERLLESLGMVGGKSCVLRAICEAHEHPLQQHGYGLFGEAITLLFSISRSAFAATHLRKHLEAEENGKAGNCSGYFQTCPSSIFYWEEVVEPLTQKETEDWDINGEDQEDKLDSIGINFSWMKLFG